MSDSLRSPVGASTYPVEHWMTPDETRNAGYAEYWDDPANERGKPFAVEGDDYTGLERYLGEVGLVADLEHCMEHLARRGTPIAGTGVDVAAGTLWAVPKLLAQDGVDRVYCVEYSRHRLLELGPRVLEHYGVRPEQVVLAYGSFYDLRLEPGSCGFAFLSQAFHHADDPGALLGELARVLRPGAPAIIVGEHRIRARDVAYYAAKAALTPAPLRFQRRLMRNPLPRWPKVRPRGADLIPVEPDMGDHVYRRHEYDELFSAAGFDHEALRRPGSHYQSFLITLRR